MSTRTQSANPFRVEGRKFDNLALARAWAQTHANRTGDAVPVWREGGHKPEDTVRPQGRLCRHCGEMDDTSNETLDAIHWELDREWNSDTLQCIATLLREVGYVIAERKTAEAA